MATSINFALPTFTPPDLSALQNVQFPADLTNALTTLNDSLPTLDELRADLEAFIAKPFNAVRADVKTNMANFAIDRSLFPIPERNSVAYCADLDTTFLDDFGAMLRKAILIIMAILLLGGLLCYVVLYFIEGYTYRANIRNVERTRTAWSLTLSDPMTPKQPEQELSIPSLLTFLQIQQHPLLELFRIRLLPLARTPRARINSSWFLAYITHPSALLLLLVGVLSFCLVEVQFLFLSVVRNRGNDVINQGLSGLSTQALTRVQLSMADTSTTFASQSNAVMAKIADEINNDMVSILAFWHLDCRLTMVCRNSSAGSIRRRRR